MMHPSFKDIAARGFSPIPVVPKAKGPGDFDGKQWVGLEGWSTFFHAPPETYDRWQRWLVELGAGMGLLGGAILGVDIDVLDEVLAGEAERIVRSILGDTPLIRIGKAPKRLLVYRAAEVMAKRTSAVFDYDGQKCQIEVLARGQQFVAFGTHPDTRQPYTWPQKRPDEVGLDDLPAVTKEQVATMLLAFEAHVEMFGGERQSGGGAAADGEGKSAPPADQRGLVESAMQHLPNDDIHYDDWVRVGIALKRSLPADPGLAQQIFHDWSAKASKYDPEVTERAWSSFSDDSRERTVGAGTIYKLAGDAGWTPPRPLPEEEFEEPVVEEVSLPLPVQNIGDFGWSNHRDYLVRGLLNRGMIAITSGEANAGKSPVMLDLAVAIMRGQQWNGMRVIKPWYVLHISTEGWTGLKDRMKALGVAHDIKPGEPMDFVATSLDLRNSAKSARDIIKTVKARAAHFGLEAGLVVVDTLSHAMGGGDDSNQEHMKAVLTNCRRIATETGAAVMLIHHPTKDGASKIRGTGITKDDTDLHIWVEADKATESRTLSTPRTKEYAQIRPIKFNIKVVPLGEDQYGDPITSVVVEWAGSAESEFPVVLSKQSRKLWADATRYVLKESPEDVQGVKMEIGGWVKTTSVPRDTLKGLLPGLVEVGVMGVTQVQKGKTLSNLYYLRKLDEVGDAG